MAITNKQRLGRYKYTGPYVDFLEVNIWRGMRDGHECEFYLHRGTEVMIPDYPKNWKRVMDLPDASPVGAQGGNDNASKDGYSVTLRVRFDSKEEADWALEHLNTPYLRGEAMFDGLSAKIKGTR